MGYVSFGWIGEDREITVKVVDGVWHTVHIVNGEPDGSLHEDSWLEHPADSLDGGDGPRDGDPGAGRQEPARQDLLTWNGGLWVPAFTGTTG